MTSETGGVLLRFDEPGGRRSLVLEDNGSVAYAYLLDGDSIVGDVWLYNVGQDPDAVDWRDRSAMPFRNPARYCADDEVSRLRPHADVSCHWSDKGVSVSVAGSLWARLENGSKPGWSRKARLAGPLAKPLVNPNQVPESGATQS